MASVNKVIIIGNLGADPEVRHLENGSVVANFNVATTEKYKGKNGEPVEQTEWFRVEVWDSLAGVAEKYLKKGGQVYVEGKLRSEKYVDKNQVERTAMKIRATSMTLLGGRGGENISSEETPMTVSKPKPVQQNTNSSFNDAPIGGEDDLPF
ncbi:MAG: single-stranded DNA-binding protein [Verrucomicrobia bacterium]|nr:single-stranded DNA-binding protein [Cytophagales bacterium]